jgi:cytochrome c peroxidase
MVGRAIAEFEFTLVFANAPIDRFARGERSAMTEDQKRGALLFFGKARCATCHSASASFNEMFSDFSHFVIGIPQIAPMETNAEFDGPGRDEDFGLEQITGKAADRYRFRTSPLRNIGVQPTFFHNGAFTSLEDAVRHYMNIRESARSFESNRRHLDADLAVRLGPIEPVLERVDFLLAQPIELTEEEFLQLVEFVRNGLLDERAKAENLRRLIPETVPSGRPVPVFE